MRQRRDSLQHNRQVDQCWLPRTARIIIDIRRVWRSRSASSDTVPKKKFPGGFAASSASQSEPRCCKGKREKNKGKLIPHAPEPDGCCYGAPARSCSGKTRGGPWDCSTTNRRAAFGVARRRTRRILRRLGRVVFLVVPVRRPLEDIPQHVVEPPGVWPLLAYRVGLASAVFRYQAISSSFP